MSDPPLPPPRPCPQCGETMEPGWLWGHGIHWSTERVTMFHPGELLIPAAPGFASGPQRPSLRCRRCDLVLLFYMMEG